MKNGEQPSEPDVSRASESLFHGGFGGNTHLIPSVGPYFHGPREQYEDIVGADPSKPRPNAWDQIAHHPNFGGLRIYYEGGDPSQRWARIVPDEADPNRKVLRFCLVESNVTIEWPQGPQHKARVQAELYGNTCIREFCQTVRLRLHEDMRLLEEYPKSIGMAGDWLTLFEFWNRPWWSDFPYPFRISVGIVKPDPKPGTKLFFSVHGQKMFNQQKIETLWHEMNESFAVPFSKWINIELYYLEGDQEGGRFYFSVAPEGGKRQIIVDVHDCTHHPDNPAPEGLTHMNPMKLYTSADMVTFLRERGSAMQIDWDDLSFWKARRPA